MQRHRYLVFIHFLNAVEREITADMPIHVVKCKSIPVLVAELGWCYPKTGSNLLSAPPAARIYMGIGHSEPNSAFLLLNDTQSARFDVEYHSSTELEAKFLLLKKLINDRAFTVLDLGGGNGLFVDHLLAHFPRSSATILDSSLLLLGKNSQSDRKELIHGSIEHMSSILRGRTFDCITMNWVLHHLVGNRYRTCRENCLKTLTQCKELLKPNGLLIVAENMFEGYLRTNLPSHLIYAITVLRWPWYVHLMKRFFNTAGVGVCFQSQRVWHRMFVHAGFDVVTFQRGLVWWWLEHSFRRLDFNSMAIRLLFIKSVSHGHFFLVPKPVS